jgi:hypothetical protein
VAADRSVVVALTVVLFSVTEPVSLVRPTVEAVIVEPEAVLRSAEVASTDKVVPAVELFKVTADVDWSVTEAEVPALSVSDVASVLLMLTEPLVAEAVRLAVLMLPPLI